ncbi:M60 family metallopeptidase [Chryseobacterium sp. JUb7]|uniref:M60 family metallopeptidase n=1 Tax=Chryseobacterium sp. JUb7 TaxID=2940599 RepID=UPI00216A9E58|nr:M60 family metallopeptidase [Chryseobacterium sp. JUb7]MCS3531843.1 hypothetical protein [Chryseobacterium sp. JUb7]
MEKKLLFIVLFWSTMIFAQQEYKIPAMNVTSLQTPQTGHETWQCNDENVNTLYISNNSLNIGIPDRLDFNFSKTVKSVNKLVYKPRATGTDGIWTSVKISYSTQANPSVFINATGIISLAEDNTAKTITLPNPIVKPAMIRIDVLGGKNNFSSCAEMEFYSSENMTSASTECALPTSGISNYQDVKVTPQVNGSSASSFQNGYNIEKSFDGDPTTLYHSSWSSATVFPVKLIYRFNGQTPINYLKYIPRPGGGSHNGFFGNIKISYNTSSNANYIVIATQNFQQNGTARTVYFPNTITPLNIKIEVLDGFGNYASCAEMEFYRNNPNSLNPLAYANIFNDTIFGGLKSNVTQQNINAISSPFVKALAQCLFNNTYNKKYRVKEFRPYKTLESINTQYKIGGYNPFENATGIVFEANTTAVIFAKDITDESPVNLRVKNFANETNAENSIYPLKNGLNIINITNKGLGYISYFTDKASAPTVKLNITTGIINGIYTTGITDSKDWIEMLGNGVYPKVDIEGHYAQLLIDKSAIKNFHYTTPQPLIDKYDVITKSEREMMGFFKFNKNFKNRQFVYTASQGGWFAGGIGVHLDLTWGVPRAVSASNLAIWGVAHELGHVNQVSPGIRWVGTTEITNNIYSLWADYNLYPPVDNKKLTGIEREIAYKTAFPSVVGNRFGEFIIQTKINGKSFSDQLRADFVNPKDQQIRTLVPFWQLMLYYQIAGASKNAPALAFDTNMSDENTATNPTSPPAGTPDYAHWFGTVVEKVRNTNESQLTNGQLVMNFVKNTCDAVHEDLTDFFTTTGFLVPINATIKDYSNGQLTITQSMIDEVKAYVASKGYAKPTSPVISYISANSVNIYKNKLPLSGVTGVGAQVMSNAQGQFLLVDNSKWNNAVAFETYDTNSKLISVSVVGTGDLSMVNTYVDFPSNAQKVYAVGYDGQKILVYPASTLATEEVVLKDSKLIIYPNPVKNGDRVTISIKNAKGKYTAKIHNLSGQSVFEYNGTIEEINEKINNQFNRLLQGMYIISLSNGNENYTGKIIKN